MSRAIPIKTFANATLKGIENAHSAYEEWSGGSWLWEAPEYLLTTYIAQSISKSLRNRADWYLTLEHHATRAIEFAGARGRGRLASEIRANGRFDILLWWGKDTPRALVEVKNQVTDIKQISLDCSRIKKVLLRNHGNSSFQFGVLAFYIASKKRTVAKAEKFIEDRIKTLKSGVTSMVGPHVDVEVIQSKVNCIEACDSAWTAVAIVLKSKRVFD